MRAADNLHSTYCVKRIDRALVCSVGKNNMILITLVKVVVDGVISVIFGFTSERQPAIEGLYSRSTIMRFGEACWPCRLQCSAVHWKWTFSAYIWPVAIDAPVTLSKNTRVGLPLPNIYRPMVWESLGMRYAWKKKKSELELFEISYKKC